jgi:hypothetical protein
MEMGMRAAVVQVLGVVVTVLAILLCVLLIRASQAPRGLVERVWLPPSGAGASR